MTFLRLAVGLALLLLQMLAATANPLGLTLRQRLGLGWGAWRRVARVKQLAPAGAWRIWLILSGRGWGKTRVGAEQVVRWALETPGVRIALVAATFDDGRDVMVEGESGVLAVLQRYGMREGKVPAPGVFTWNRSLGQLVLPNGSRMDLYSGQKPRQLRGPQHHYAWCDELPHWQYPRATWRQVRYGLRLPHPTDRAIPFRTQTIVTTTPLPIPLIRELLQRDDVHLTRGSTYENKANLDPETLAELQADLEGTPEGRQELHGEVLDDVAGALVTRADVERARAEVEVPELTKLVVAMDPAVEDDEDTNDATGYVAAGIGLPLHPGAMHADKPHLYVLHCDQQWLEATKAMQHAARLWDAYDADRVTIEANNGGGYLPAVLHLVDVAEVGERVPHKIVKAPSKISKKERAMPLAALYAQGRVHHVGPQGFLEDELTTWTGLKGQASPNVLDAAVWAMLDMIPTPLGTTGRKRVAAKLHG